MTALKSAKANERVFISALTHEGNSAYVLAKLDADKALTDVEGEVNSPDEKYVSSLLRAWYGFATMLHFEMQKQSLDKQTQNRYADGAKQCSFETNAIIRPETITGKETRAAGSRTSCLDAYEAMLKGLSRTREIPKERYRSSSETVSRANLLKKEVEDIRIGAV